MLAADILRHRLINQGIAQSTFTQPEQVVAHLGAMQSQDWSMAKWAIGLRFPGSTEADVEKAFNEGRILRTHVLRPTWHFVSPADIRWILKLSAPRVHTLNGLYYRKFEITENVLKKTRDIMQRALTGHNYLTREALNDKFAKAKISADRLKLAYIMMHAELEGFICSGPRDGKQFTYAWLDERAPKSASKTEEEALQKLATIFFASRGPATQADFAWWSGLKVADCKKAIASLDKSFSQFDLGDKTYTWQERKLPSWRGVQETFLMPDYDEYGIGYKDRSICNHPTWKQPAKTPGFEFLHAIAVDGFYGGTWSKLTKGDKPVITVTPFSSLPAKYKPAIAKAVKDYNRFFGVE